MDLLDRVRAALIKAEQKLSDPEALRLVKATRLEVDRKLGLSTEGTWLAAAFRNGQRPNFVAAVGKWTIHSESAKRFATQAEAMEALAGLSGHWATRKLWEFKALTEEDVTAFKVMKAIAGQE